MCKSNIKPNLHNIRIVLVRTFHPGNIGSAARSMKNMGLSSLHLIEPRDYPASEAERMAAGAVDVLQQAYEHSHINDALSDCTFIAATTARPRGYDLPVLTPQQAAEKLVHHSQHSPVALLFGPERMGLHNNHLKFAKYRISIPADPKYNSLNLAAAVQIMSYEIFKASEHPQNTNITAKDQLPKAHQIELLHQHLERVLHDIQFLRPHQGETLQRIHNMLARAQLTNSDLNILRGILSAIERAAHH